jgi:hypothetical protein
MGNRQKPRTWLYTVAVVLLAACAVAPRPVVSAPKAARGVPEEVAATAAPAASGGAPVQTVSTAAPDPSDGWSSNEAPPAACPSNAPVDCGTWCCPADAHCQPDAPAGARCKLDDPKVAACPAGFPLDCGDYCCPGTAACNPSGPPGKRCVG